MRWVRLIATGFTGLTSVSLLVSGVVCPPGAVASPACTVRPLLPHLVAFAHPVERREISLKTTCVLHGPVKLAVFRGGERVGSIVWSGDMARRVGNGALGTMTLSQDRTPPGRDTVPPQPVGTGGIRSVGGRFTAKDATRATLRFGTSGGHRVAYGVTELFDGGWNKQELTARLEVERRGIWVLYRRFDSDAKASQGFYGDFRVRIPQTPALYRVTIRATSERAKSVSPSRRSSVPGDHQSRGT